MEFFESIVAGNRMLPVLHAIEIGHRLPCFLVSDDK